MHIIKMLSQQVTGFKVQPCGRVRSAVPLAVALSGEVLIAGTQQYFGWQDV